jgi:hypothetical protein
MIFSSMAATTIEPPPYGDGVTGGSCTAALT